jgi:hypothetical protein
MSRGDDATITRLYQLRVAANKSNLPNPGRESSAALK